MNNLVALTLAVTFGIAFGIIGLGLVTLDVVDPAASSSANRAAIPPQEVPPSVDSEAVTQSLESGLASVQPSSSPVNSSEIAQDTCGVKGGSCTTAAIAKHNSKTDCWVIYEGNYFDVTSFVTSHEGGSAVFNNSTCGKDIKSFLSGQQSSAGRTNQHSASAYSLLEQFLVGKVLP